MRYCSLTLSEPLRITIRKCIYDHFKIEDRFQQYHPHVTIGRDDKSFGFNNTDFSDPSFEFTDVEIHE
jgi:2'-5' RNA ligase